MQLKVYLDNCCFNRPYDNQQYLLVRLETEAKLTIQKLAKDEEIKLIWSFVLDYENAANPYEEKRESIEVWRNVASEIVQISQAVSDKAAEYMKLGIRQKDASHIACAVVAGADCFITTDKKILNKNIMDVEILNPIDFLRRHYDE
jgi:predicted nucleic acid-binding protein